MTLYVTPGSELVTVWVSVTADGDRCLWISLLDARRFAIMNRAELFMYELPVDASYKTEWHEDYRNESFREKMRAKLVLIGALRG